MNRKIGDRVRVFSEEIRIHNDLAGTIVFIPDPSPTGPNGKYIGVRLDGRDDGLNGLPFLPEELVPYRNGLEIVFEYLDRFPSIGKKLR
jgi:hypothetical protein